MTKTNDLAEYNYPDDLKNRDNTIFPFIRQQATRDSYEDEFKTSFLPNVKIEIPTFDQQLLRAEIIYKKSI